MIGAAKKKQLTKLLFVCYNYWDLYNFRCDVIGHFLKLGYEVHTAAIKDKYAEKLAAMGCKTHFIHFNNRGLNPIKDLLFFLKLKRLYKHVQPHLIFHYAIKPNVYGSIAASQLNINSAAIITGLGYPFATNNWLSWLVKKLYRYALKRVNDVFVLNEEDRALFIKNHIVPAGKIKLLQSEGININRFQPLVKVRTENPFTFLMATRLIWSKGVGIFARASEILKAKGHQFHCKVAGFFEADHPDSIPQETIKDWQNRHLLEYIGFHDNMLPLFENAQCFVLPTYYHEGVPRSLLEACAMQVPCITTNNSGCKEVIKDEYNGLLCSSNNANDLALKMEKVLLMNKENLETMGKNGRKSVSEKFNIGLIIKEYETVLSRYNF